MLDRVPGATRRSHRLPKPNARNRMDGLDLLSRGPPGAAKAVFLDPQYRGLLDKMKYGNEGKGRERGRSALPQMENFAIGQMVEAAAVALAPSGYLFLWVDKFSLAEGLHDRYLAHAPLLATVDLIAWNKGRIGMGRRARCQTEYLVVAQKQPTRAKGTWSDHRIGDSWIEQSDRSEHPHAKPYQLIERLIRAVTRRGDLVIDPCAGSYVVLAACQASSREFLGCDLIS